MDKHTEGPWSKDGTEIRGAYASSGIVAVTPTIEDGGVIERVTNARLIAAAPELLEAVRDLLYAATLPLKEKGERWDSARALVEKVVGE